MASLRVAGPAGQGLRLVLAAVVLAVLAGCASRPGGSGSGSGSSGASSARPGRDGPGTAPPGNLARVPDAEPRVEAIRSGGPNKPYVVLGRGYTPMDPASGYRDSGLASWYGAKFHGASTSSGEPYDMYAMTAAHPTLPIPSYARVRNPANGREIIVRVNDRGPFHDGRIIDLSYTAAYKLDLLRGVAPVEVERIMPAEIVAGSWRRGNTGGGDAGGAGGAVLAQAAVPAAAPAVPVPRRLVAPAVYVPPATSTAPSATVYAPPASALPSPDDPLAGFAAVPLEVTARDAGQDEALPPPAAIVVTALPTLPAVGAEVAAPPASLATVGEVSGNFWVQLGAFSQPDSAATLQRRADGASAGRAVVVLADGALHRVQAGPFASRDAARDAAARLGATLQIAPIVVERR